jgi:hypothetical protein
LALKAKIEIARRFWMVTIKAEKEIKNPAMERIKDSIHYYTPHFLQDHLKVKIPVKVIEVLQQTDEANEVLHALIDDWEDILDDAINYDGFGSVFHSYDGSSQEVLVENDSYYCKFIVMRID